MQPASAPRRLAQLAHQWSTSTWTGQKRKTSTRDSWYDLPTGHKRAVFSTAFTRAGLAVQLDFNDHNPTVNLDRFEVSHAKKDQFEQALGEEAKWDQMPGRRATWVYVTSPFDDVADVDQRPEMIDWLVDQHARFRRAIQAIGGLESLA